MQQRVRFIHTADLHLGSNIRVSGNLPEQLDQLINNGVNEAFGRICELALENNVDFIIISGDVFDERERSINASNYFMEQCRRLKEANINIYAIAGNHDPYNEGSQLLDYPDNFYLFDSEEVEIKEITDRKGNKIARLLGQSYRGKADSRKMYSYYTVPDEGLWNIGLLHTELDPGNNRYVPCSFTDLVKKDDIHYWALGHIHKSQILRKGQPVISFPGIPQGRDIGETGWGGCFLVDLFPDGNSCIEFHPTSSIVWLREEIKVDERENPPQNLDELKELIIEKSNNLSQNLNSQLSKSINFDQQSYQNIIKGYIVRWEITGRSNLYQNLQDQLEEATSYLEEELRSRLQYSQPFIWSDSVQFSLSPSLPDWDILKKKVNIFNELEEVRKLCLNDEEVKRELIKEWGQIWESEIDPENYNEKCFQVREQDFNKIVEQAFKLVAARLWEERRD